jgi:hypothetical protein
MTTTQYNTFEETTISRMLRELQSNLSDAVESGDMTDMEANEWFNMKADQWAQGLS